VDKSSSRTAAPLNVCSKERDQVGGRSPRSGLAEGRGQQGIQVRAALLYPSIGAAGAMIETGLGETAAAFVSSSPHFVVAGLPGWPACSEEGGTIMRFAEKSAWSAGDYPLVPTAVPSPPDAGLGEHRR
jgi:hypothetical protein